MTQQEPERRGNAAVYDDQNSSPLHHYDQDIAMAIRTPADRVRWGSILAGLFTALTTGLLLTLLALALGLAAYDQTTTARNFGIGSAIIAGVIWLLAFGVGGYVAARTGAFPGRSNGVFNGLMVGIVGIPLLLWGLTGLIGGLLGTAGSVAGTAAQTLAPAAAQGAEAANVDPQALQATAQAALPSPGAVQEQVQQQLQQANPEQVANAARNAALGALAPLVLGLAAAATGGAMGARKLEEEHIAVDA